MRRKSVILATRPVTTLPSCIFLSSGQPRILHHQISGSVQSWSSLMSLIRTVSFSTNLEHLLRMLYTAPGHLRDMKQSVSSAKIYECTKVGNIFNNVPSTTSPTWIRSKSSFCISAFLATRSCLRSPMILLLLGLNSADYKLDLLTGIFAEGFSHKYQIPGLPG